MTVTSDSSFHQNFDRHGSWRREFALRLKLLVEWLKENSLLSVAVEERLIQLESLVRNDCGDTRQPPLAPAIATRQNPAGLFSQSSQAFAGAAEQQSH